MERKISRRHNISMSDNTYVEDFYKRCFEEFRKSEVNKELNASLEEVTLVVDANMNRILKNGEGKLKIKYRVKIDNVKFEEFVKKVRLYDLVAYEYNMLLTDNNLCNCLENIQFDGIENHQENFQCNCDAELLKKAIILIIQEENEQARTLLSDLAKRNLFKSHTKKYLAYLEMRDQNYDEAINQFKEISDLDSDKMALFHLAMALIMKGDVSASQIFLERLLRKWPDYSKGHFLLGISYKKQGVIDAAIDSFAEALKFKNFKNDRCNILFERSKTYYYDGNLNHSLSDINTAIDVCQSNHLYYYFRSLVKETAFGFWSGSQDLERSCSLGNKKACNELSYVNKTYESIEKSWELYLDGSFEKAKDQLPPDILDSRRFNIVARLIYGSIAYQENDYLNAIQYIDPVLNSMDKLSKVKPMIFSGETTEMFNGFLGHAIYVKGMSLFYLEQYKESISFLKQYEKMNNNMMAKLALGYSYYHTEQYGQALENYLEAFEKIKDIKTREELIYNIACSYAKIGKTNKALGWLARLKNSADIIEWVKKTNEDPDLIGILDEIHNKLPFFSISK
jgi:tetratricopeptide (TPR) repeat protein